MATNIAKRSSTSTSITIGAWYQGSPNAYSAEFFRVGGSKFGTDYAHPIGSGNWTTSDFTCTGLQPNTTYQFYVNFLGFSGNKLEDTGIVSYTTDGGGGGDPDPPTDTTPPIVSGVSATSVLQSANNYSVRLDWSAYDLDSGLSHFWVYRSTPNNTTIPENGVYVDRSQRQYTFTTDNNGNAFKSGNTYYFQVRAIDMEGNLSSNSTGKTSLYIKANKPLPWTGFTHILYNGEYYGSSGKDQYPISASEWNLFTAKINEFRVYSLGAGSEYSFTTVSRGTPFTATIINQAIKSINGIGYNIPEVYSGNKITAETFSLMKARLNAIY